MKAIIVISGVSDGKNKFDELIKANGYWTWNINPANVLSVASRELGWDGNRDNKHYEFIEKMGNIADEYYNFKYWYIETMIGKMNAHEKANVLLIHGCKDELTKSIQEDFGGFSIHIVKSEKDANYLQGLYDRVLFFDEDNPKSFEEDVLKVMKIITEDVKEG